MEPILRALHAWSNYSLLLIPTRGFFVHGGFRLDRVSGKVSAPGAVLEIHPCVLSIAIRRAG